MNQPQPGDYIDIHVHDGKPAPGKFILESLMAHEGKMPGDSQGIAYSFGIHPWFLSENNQEQQLALVNEVAHEPLIIGIGEAGFDKLKGPSIGLQRRVFEAQVEISETKRKPLIIHCVRSWDELLSSHKNMKPEMPWLIHGFRGKIQLAEQLISKGFFLSIWFEFAIRPESSDLIKYLFPGRIFLETDGANIDIRDIYNKVSSDLSVPVEELKSVIFENFNSLFNKT